VTGDVQAEEAPADEQAIPVVRRRRGMRIGVWLVVAALVLAGGALTAVTASRDHWLDARRQVTMHQLNIVGHPAGFHPVKADATDPGPAGWDAKDQLGRRYFAGQLEPDEMSAALNFWLGRAGLLTADGPRESQRCLRTELEGLPTFGCGNFYRETPQWRIWITVSGQGWPGNVVPAARKPADVHLAVVVQHKKPTAKAYSALPWTSPGLTQSLPGGRARTVLSLSSTQAKQADLDGATFGPQGQLVTAGPGLPVVVPATQGAPATMLTYDAWPSVSHELEPVQRDATVADTARIGPDGALWVHFAGYGLRRLDPDGTATNITGVSNGDGQIADGPAMGQDPYPVGEPTAISADGTVWVADGQLVRIRTGKLHVIDPSLHGVASVVGDGRNGIYFGTATQVFHLTAAGVRTPIGEQGHFTGVTSLALAKDGSLFVLDGAYLRRVRPNGSIDNVAGLGGTIAGRGDPVFCARRVPTVAARVPISAAYDVIASPLGGVFLTGCNRLVQIGNE
jgi:hypothetical protein